MSELLVVTGPVGVGKTTVAWEVVEVLDEHGIPFGFFDPDAIHFRPVEPGDPYGYSVGMAALDAAWPLMPADRLVMPLVVERREALAHFADWDVTIVRLTAPPEVVAGRLRGREIGAALQWHLDRAAELDAHWRLNPVEDFVVETGDRPVREIAAEVLSRAGWIR